MNKKKILLVDDEKSIRNALRKDFEYEGYAVSTAVSGEEAITRLRSQHFDLVITDLVMEGVDGIAVLQEAKAQDADTGTIILTGFGDMTSAIDALRLGADDYLLKPYDSEELFLRAARLISQQEAMRKVKLYENILPICMYCKSIRDDTGTEPGTGKWLRMEKYLHQKSGTDVSHGICPVCFENHREDYLKH